MEIGKVKTFIVPPMVIEVMLETREDAFRMKEFLNKDVNSGKNERLIFDIDNWRLANWGGDK